MHPARPTKTLLLCALQTSKWGRTILFLTGFGLVVYGLYCTFVAFFARQFPTPGPTIAELAHLREKRAQKEAKKAAKAARRAEREKAKLSDSSSGIELPEA